MNNVKQRQARILASVAAILVTAVFAYWYTRPSAKASSTAPAPPADDCSCDIEQSGEVDEERIMLQHMRVPVPRSDTNNLSEADSEDVGFINPALYPCHVKTFGCTHNTSDSETMKGLLQAAGFPIIESLLEAKVVVLNSCTVKNPSQEGAVNLALACRARGQKVVVAGCVVQADSQIAALREFSRIGVKQLDKIAEAVLETLSGNLYVSLASNRDLPSLALPRVRRNALVEIIPLSNGCLGCCTYCKTRFARGQLVSYPKEMILQRVREAVADGCQQIWLSSEDTGSWGIDRDETIVDLLEAIDEELSSDPTAADVMCRLGMTNPPYILEHLPAIASIMSRPNWFRFLHLPVQSGSDQVLERMKREYTRADFELCLDKLRDSVPDITICTDFICGFPGETDADHQDSLSLIQKYKMPAINISQFYSRPGTAAASMQKVPSDIVKKRSSEMTKVFHSYTTFDTFIDKVVEVWIDGVSEKSHHRVGRTRQYVKVLISNQYDVQVGTKVLVEIFLATKWHIEGRPVEGTHACARL